MTLMVMHRVEDVVPKYVSWRVLNWVVLILPQLSGQDKEMKLNNFKKWLSLWKYGPR